MHDCDEHQLHLTWQQGDSVATLQAELARMAECHVDRVQLLHGRLEARPRLRNDRSVDR